MLSCKTRLIGYLLTGLLPIIIGTAAAKAQSITDADETELEAMNALDADALSADLRTWQQKIAAQCGVPFPSDGRPSPQGFSEAWSACYEKNSKPTGKIVASFDPLRVNLLYSIDNAICSPISQLYNSLNHRKDSRHPPGHDPWNGWFWEYHYAAEFQNAGLIKPPHLTGHGYNPGDRMVGTWGGFNALYRLRLGAGRTSQLVWIFDVPSRSAVSTNVIVWKPRDDVPEDLWANYWGPEVREFGMLNDSTVEVGIMFGEYGRNHAFKFFSLPYIFREGNTMDRIIRTDERGRIMPYAYQEKLNLSDQVVQRAYLFRGQTIFTARELGTERALVYRIKDGTQKEDICYLGTMLMSRP